MRKGDADLQNEHKNDLGVKKSRSFAIHTLNKLFWLIYSFFARCRLIRSVTSNDKLYNEGVIVDMLKPKMSAAKGATVSNAGVLLEKGKSLNVLSKLSNGLTSLAVNIYGTFFLTYSLISLFMYYVRIMLNDQVNNGISVILTSGVVLVCSIPMVITPKSVVNVVSGSRIGRKLVLTFLAFPEEKLKSKAAVGGIEYVISAIVLATLMGALTFFFHPAYALVLIGVLIFICLISANPETCVLATIATVPFLQYSKHADDILGLLIVLGLISYFDKILRKKRTRHPALEGVLVLLLCCFILVAGIFSFSGMDTIVQSINTALIIAGGFFLTYDVIRGKERINTAVKILLSSFAIITLSGIWNMFYNAVVERNIYSLRDEVAPIFENNVIYIADSATVFSSLSVLLVPLLFANVSRRKNFKGRMFAVVLAFAAVVATYIYGTYEAVVAVSVECLIFLLLYSHKTLTAIFIASMPISAGVIMYPYLMNKFKLPGLLDGLRSILPLNDPGSAYRAENIKCVLLMIKNGAWSGIGVGDKVFEVYYHTYSDAAFGEMIGAGNEWMRLICWSGIGGLVTFAILLVLVCLKAMGHVFTSEKSIARSNMLALMCGIVGSVFLGSVSCIWTDVRMMYMFFVCCALLVGYVHDYRKDEKRRNLLFSDCGDAKAKDIEFKNHGVIDR